MRNFFWFKVQTSYSDISRIFLNNFKNLVHAYVTIASNVERNSNSVKINWKYSTWDNWWLRLAKFSSFLIRGKLWSIPKQNGYAYISVQCLGSITKKPFALVNYFWSGLNICFTHLILFLHLYNIIVCFICNAMIFRSSRTFENALQIEDFKMNWIPIFRWRDEMCAIEYSYAIKGLSAAAAAKFQPWSL